MSKRLLCLLATVFVMPIFVSPAYSQSDVSGQEGDEAQAQTSTQDIDIDNEEGLPPNEKAKKDALTEMVGEIMKGLDLNQVQHFTVIYANYMILSMVKAVELDVANAVSGCGDNNPDIKSEMQTRHTAWLSSLEQPKKESEANINNMIVAQNYLPKAKFEEIFALVDETRAKNSSEFEKVPVTTIDACKYMLGKMDETEKSMKQMLNTTLVTYPDMLKKSQE